MSGRSGLGGGSPFPVSGRHPDAPPVKVRVLPTIGQYGRIVVPDHGEARAGQTFETDRKTADDSIRHGWAEEIKPLSG
jgi:hypothetical protein